MKYSIYSTVLAPKNDVPLDNSLSPFGNNLISGNLETPNF